MSPTCISTKPGCPTRPSIRFTAAIHSMGKQAGADQAFGGVRHAVDSQAAGRASVRPAMCWCRTREDTKLDRHLFSEAYLMHTSDQPAVFSIIASCDVAAAMMEPPSGTALVEESIDP
jgi:arginine decarboxylase